MQKIEIKLKPWGHMIFEQKNKKESQDGGAHVGILLRAVPRFLILSFHMEATILRNVSSVGRRHLEWEPEIQKDIK